jgi:argininosuccinate synthase
MSEASLPAGNEPILLAFSGGLDTSFLVPWLSATYDRPIVTVTVDTGGIDSQAAKVLEQRARALGAQDHILVAAKQAYFDQVISYLIMG